MSKRLDKKKLKRQTTAIESPIAETSASKETINFFIQYQDQEYLETEIISRVKESCLLLKTGGQKSIFYIRRR